MVIFKPCEPWDTQVISRMTAGLLKAPVGLRSSLGTLYTKEFYTIVSVKSSSASTHIQPTTMPETVGWRPEPESDLPGTTLTKFGIEDYFQGKVPRN
jgi:hypothetical protein